MATGSGEVQIGRVNVDKIVAAGVDLQQPLATVLRENDVALAAIIGGNLSLTRIGSILSHFVAKLSGKAEQNRVLLDQGRESSSWALRLSSGMVTLNKKASHLRAHSWKDIGGIGGLLLGGTLFIFLLIVSCVILLIAFIIVVLDCLFSPVLALLSLCRRTSKINLNEPNIPDTENIGNSPLLSQETAKLEFLPATKVC